MGEGEDDEEADRNVKKARVSAGDVRDSPKTDGRGSGSFALILSRINLSSHIWRTRG